MRHPLLKLGRIAAVVALGASAVFAQEAGFGAEFKLRMGYQVTQSQRDHLSNQVYGFGLNLGYGTSIGRFGVEFGYQYKPGKQWLDDVSQMPLDPGVQYPANPDYSADSRKNTLEGFTIRVSYEKNFAGTPWSIQGGLQFGGSKFKHEYVADVWALYPNAQPEPIDEWEDTYNGTPTKSWVAISPYVGVRYDINANSAVELNVLALRYKSIYYQHIGGTSPANAGDHLVENTRTVPHLELGYIFRF